MSSPITCFFCAFKMWNVVTSYLGRFFLAFLISRLSVCHSWHGFWAWGRGTGWQENPWYCPEHQLSGRVRGSGIANNCVHYHACSGSCNAAPVKDMTTYLLERGDHASAENGIYTAILRIRCLRHAKDPHLRYTSSNMHIMEGASADI